MLAVKSAAMSGNRQPAAGSGNICLGVISKKQPTVSHLLVDNPQFRRDCWRIVHSPVNRHKPYTRIPENTAIYMHPETREITWTHDDPVAGPQDNSIPGVAQRSLSPDGDYDAGDDALFQQEFVKAVRAYRGQPYEMLDCYELVVQGLKDLGVQYNGAGGLKTVLMNRARSEGAPVNRYLSGEGLIQTVGRHAYGQSFNDIRDPTATLEQIKRDILPRLQEGAVLSFSTPARGHTGIVGQTADNWMFLNSGLLDNDRRNGVREGVGEEALAAEIENWVRRAANNKEPLSVNLGMIDQRRLAPFWQNVEKG